MAILTKDELLKRAAPRRGTVEVPGYGTIHLRSVTAVQQARRDASYQDAETLALAPVHMLLDQMTDENGKPMFTDEDLPELVALDPNTLGPVFEAISIWNGEEVKKALAESEDTNGS